VVLHGVALNLKHGTKSQQHEGIVPHGIGAWLHDALASR
jgi:hypothetical protein